ncbi:type II secretion system F family protein [Novosphingobium flavum]|uniref:Type II secretion system F family protein n=1 Tax=Novosphingobium flavum TaxID=1778672 RepID=A0A7X1FSR1_9SPHN|nr:type II secretion system F family protein [Novosphingobium flavum]
MTALLIRLAALIAVFASVFLLSQLLLTTWFSRRSQTRAVNKRLKLLRSGLDRQDVVSILRQNQPTRLSPDAGQIERGFFRFQQLIQTSGLSVDTRTVLAIMVIGFLALAAGLLFLGWTVQAKISTGLIELVLGMSVATTIGLPILILSQFAQRRRKRMEEQFPLALDIFTRALRAGHPIASAIDLVTQECEDPLGSEFGLVSDEVAYGAELTDALLGLADRWELEEIRMFVVSLSIQSETGGNLAEILENLTRVIRDRASLYMKVRALSSEGRMSGWMLTALPILTMVSVFMVSPQFYLEVVDDPIFVVGYVSLIMLYGIGVYVIRRMVDLKV